MPKTIEISRVNHIQPPSHPATQPYHYHTLVYDNNGPRACGSCSGACDTAPCLHGGICTEKLPPASAPAPDGHSRRALQSHACNLLARADIVNAACCGQASEDCSGGTPTSCDSECAEVFLPFWADCKEELHTSFLAKTFEKFAAVHGQNHDLGDFGY